VTGGDAIAPETLGVRSDFVVHSPSPSMPSRATPGDTVSALGSLDVVDLGAIELGLSAYPGVPSLPARWRQVEGSVEQVCLWVVAMGRLLWEVIAVVGRDILHLVWVSFLRKKRIYLSFSGRSQFS
jgi:hypothetical protein